MSYCVYENWRAHGHRATLHVGTCSFCKNGQGQTTGTRADNGKWHGPFSTLNAAQGVIPGVSPRPCSRCLG
jgi:hypothetical protein